VIESDLESEVMMQRPVETYLEEERRVVEGELRAVAAERLPQVADRLRAPVAYALSTTGKRLRPILCVAAYAAATGARPIPSAAYRLGCAIEIVHTYSLVHDDLPCMDDDDLRRGRPTLHRVFGNPLAMLAGAALLPLAIELLDEAGRRLELSAPDRARLVTELASAAGAEGMVGGQLLDLEAEHMPVDAATLEAIHRRKTGALLTASLRIGALAGSAPTDLVEALTDYGRALGLAFQIADDLLDVEGSSLDLGKTAGRDAALSKASYPALFGVEGARALAAERAEEARRAIQGHDLPELVAITRFVVARRR
jgi:geranylgeranyl diphosphate synthase, type II